MHSRLFSCQLSLLVVYYSLMLLTSSFLTLVALFIFLGFQGSNLTQLVKFQCLIWPTDFLASDLKQQLNLGQS